jgi:hypothetical protein
VRPTLGKEPAAEEANPVGYLLGDTGIGLATFSYNPSMTSCLQTLRRLTIICLISPAAPQNSAPATSQRAATVLTGNRPQITPVTLSTGGFTKLMQFYGNQLRAWELSMANPTESKRRAEECRQLASLEPDEDDQAFWLRMAEEWERLANLAIRPKEKASPHQNLELQ